MIWILIEIDLNKHRFMPWELYYYFVYINNKIYIKILKYSVFCVQVAVITSSKYIGFSIDCFIWKPFLFGVVVCWCKVSGCSVEQFGSNEIKNKHSLELNVYIIMFGKSWWYEVYSVCLKWWSNTSHILVFKHWQSFRLTIVYYILIQLYFTR